MWLKTSGPALIALVFALASGATFFNAILIAAAVSVVAGILVGAVQELQRRGGAPTGEDLAQGRDALHRALQAIGVNAQIADTVPDEERLGPSIDISGGSIGSITVLEALKGGSYVIVSSIATTHLVEPAGVLISFNEGDYIQMAALNAGTAVGLGWRHEIALEEELRAKQEAPAASRRKKAHRQQQTWSRYSRACSTGSTQTR